MSQRQGYILAGLLLLVIITFVAAFSMWNGRNIDNAVATERAWMTQQAD